MDKLLSAVGLEGIPFIKSKRDDDVIDRFSHRFSVLILVGFAVAVSTQQFVGDPIHCWLPAHLNLPDDDDDDDEDDDGHQDYTNSYCWVRNTYYLPYNEYVPREHEHEKRLMISYYQWIPVILLFQALLFYLPYAVWTALSSRSGIDISNIVMAGESLTVTDMTEIRDKTLMYMTTVMDRYLRCHTNAVIDDTRDCSVSIKHYLSRLCFRTVGRRQGNYLMIVYIFVKVLYLANIIGQLFLLDYFLGPKYHSYGFDVLRGIVQTGEDWPFTASARFPRATMCDMKIRRLGNVHRYSIMCVLPINLFNEKIFLLIYFWLIFLAIVTFISLCTWIGRFMLKSGRRHYVKRHLMYLGKLGTDRAKKKTLPQFVHNYLGQDGVFLLRLVSHNTNTVAATEFIAALWENYKKKPIVTKKDDSDADV